MGWALISYNREFHVVPVGDIFIHELSDDCICGTENQAHQRADGSYGWLVTHCSLDGREANETSDG